MDKMIEKYIYAVTLRCPQDKKDEIKKELESNILDMLSAYPNYTEDDVEAVLHKIGHPIDVAYQYQNKDQHVVDPRFYQDYKIILKLGLIFAAMMAIIVGVIVTLSNVDFTDPIQIFTMLLAEIISNMFIFASSAFTIITLIFWAYKLPSFKTKIDDTMNSWKADKLPEVPKIEPTLAMKTRVQLLIEMIIVIILMLTFSILFIVYYDTIAVIFVNGDSSTLLNTAYKGIFTLFVISTNVLVILNYLYKFYVGSETLYTLILSTVTEFYSSIFMVVLLLLPDVILPKNYELLANYFETSLSNVLNIANFITYLMIFIILLTSTITYFNRWLKYFKNRLKKS